MRRCDISGRLIRQIHRRVRARGGNSIWLKYVQMKLGACDAMAVSPAADHLSGKMMSKQPPDKKTSSSNTLSLQMFPIWQLLIWPAAAQSLNFLSHLFSVYFWMNFCFGVESQKSPAPPTSRLVGPCIESLSAAFCVSNRKRTNGEKMISGALWVCAAIAASGINIVKWCCEGFFGAGVLCALYHTATFSNPIW